MKILKNIHKRFQLFLMSYDKLLLFAIFALMIFGTLMIFSAEMGNAITKGNIENSMYLFDAIKKQIIIIILSLFFMIVFALIDYTKITLRIYNILAIIIAVILISIKYIWGGVDGAYAWMKLPGFTIQPSEFAKILIILLYAKMFSSNHKNMIDVFKNAITIGVAFTLIVVFLQKDTGTGMIIFVLSYLLLLVPTNKEFAIIQRYMYILMFVVIIGVFVLLSPFGTAILEKMDGGYRLGRFLASANPFKYQYSQGYHLVMSLVSFATGGILGLGYGRSIHKYMNFPNPENDFILPIVIEELGLFGFTIIIVLYGIILYRIIKVVLKKNVDLRAKIVLLGISLYFILHFILNVGGVSGLIPLTGVPLLLVSAGGTSWLSSLISLGIAQNEIARIKRKEMGIE